MSTMERGKSQRLMTTTPETSVGAALQNIKPNISKKLLDGLPIRKVSSKGTLVPRLLTLSDDLFTLFVSHQKVGKSKSLTDRIRFKVYASVVSTVTYNKKFFKQPPGTTSVIDVADILFVQGGFVGSRKVEACRASGLDPKRVISIFHNNLNTTDFLVGDEEDMKEVMNAIEIIREVYHASKLMVGREELLLRYTWYDIDLNKSGLMEQEEFLQLLSRINIYMKQEKAIKMFKDYVAAKHPKKRGRLGGKKHSHFGITFQECLDILRMIKLEQNAGKEMSDVIFDDLFGKKDTASVEEFLTVFLHQKQNDISATVDDVKKLFSHMNSMEISGCPRRIGADGKGEEDSIDRARFAEFCLSSANDLYDPEKQKFDPQTMLRPVTEYWINSSHNTYLTGDQLKSLSSVEMYAVAMQRGCKCLELDCWDGEGYPIIYHGFTLTSKISFQSVITCVRAYIDAHPDTLPIILSLEMHCSHSFQEMCAKILSDTLKDRLYIHEPSGPLPTPLDLRGKAVIKGKRPPEAEDDETALQSMNSVRSEEEEFETALVDGISSKIGGSISMSKSSDSGVFDSVKGKLKSTMRAKNSDGPPLPKTHPDLARLTLFNGAKFKDLRMSASLPLEDMHSFSEGKVLKVLNRDPAANVALWREYNREHMTRIYPSGARVDSSNYNPVIGWHLGSQLVALNFQTDSDSPMAINDGRFREQGGCGYVHKPPGVLTTDGEEPNSGSKTQLRIKVLSGSCLPKPYGESVGEVIDPYVILRLHDVDKGRSPVPGLAVPGAAEWLTTTERKTKSVRDNGFCPKWNEPEYFEFTVNSDAAMCEIIVMDSDRGMIDDLMCKSAIPVSCLRHGIRCVQFYDRGSQHGPFEMARILVDVEIVKSPA